MPFANQTASTKRAALTGGKRGAPATYLTGLKCTPADPAEPQRREELVQQYKLEGAPRRLYECFLEGQPDILASDRFVIGSREYVVRAVAQWDAAGSLPAYTGLVLEDAVT